MFRFRQNNSLLSGAFTTAELIFHSTVNNLRASHSNAVLALVINILRTLVIFGSFYLMFTIIPGMRRAAAIRGDFVLYLMAGVMLFMAHIRAVSSIMGAGNPLGGMMLHAPMNTIISIAAAGLSALYIQVLSISVILFVYHALVNPIVIEDPVGAFGMLLIAWGTGCAFGLLLLALRPWLPTLTGILVTFHRRANMIFSGKMVLGNSLSGYMLPLFDWNPLFHAIDQCRGFVFRNYFPQNSSWEYAVWVGVGLVMLGLMGEFFTRRRVSISWFARR
ncbi:ABC-type polysaccharide/polyol phosphate export permease [Cribrihabitans marinus]|uniref:ABC-type polysaccharide/polyol phosphate export permease n=1 Tax=Cribrihabitans marinus TaxID=1227549 RepID=A0A1H6YM90_9RHOB|nr:ABC transporter permease [Cribrihabitans marinus]SEJ38360.1 ABC-type polysaccharide/polyol phosphate export permease [Cribrihabitans marinus]